MANPAVLRIIFGDASDSRKLHLPYGIPASVEELHVLIKTFFQLKEDFRIQFMDSDFNEFMNLTSVSDIQNKSTLKIICNPILSPVEPCITLYTIDSFSETSANTCSEPETPVSSIASSCSDDTLYTSTPHSSPETRPSRLPSWPNVFLVPKFTYEAEFELQQKNTEFETNGTYFNPGPKLKGVILDGLAQEMMKYAKYPKDYQCEEVAAALTRAHPCLGQLGSKTGSWGWKKSLKYKMQNFRTKLGRLRHPEIRLNSLKHKREGQGKAAANIKKPRKAEVNYIPLHPKGETTESLENERIALLSELKKRDNEVVIKKKMGKTFSHRRLEIVEQRPLIEDFVNRWPALFQQSEVNAEFMRITTKPLQSNFMSQLDHFSNKLMQIFKSKGGVKGQRIKEVLSITDLAPATEDAERDLATTVMGIYVIRSDGDQEPEDVGVVIEGIKVLSNLGSVIMGFIMLFGLIYALDLSFPDNLKYTFEFFQKIIMNLDGHKLNAKIQQLKIKLFA
ncbi:uncharacterized protein LOC127653727 [Xyrauchen texanus]|uniref:uncharacterized protein LOC127653727 n=1 Tax=Xyrauchen texanus TaxID=154827 RepID=UPI002241E6BA|nr:uncharacterized protein LOC127653727 [Xyrauchen texanus]